MDNPVYIGVDVGKHSLFCAAPGRKVQEFNSDDQGVRAMLDFCGETAKPDQLMFVMEATGGYAMQAATRILQTSASSVAIVPPACVLGYINTGIRRSKNDRADAIAIRGFAEIARPKAWMPRSETMQALRDLQLVLAGLTDTITRSKCRLEKLENRRSGNALAVTREQEILRANEITRCQVQEDINALVRADPELARDAALIESINGVGVATRTVLMGLCYEQLKTLSQRKLLAHCGMNPHEFQSGKYKGQTRMNKHGDARIRAVLYMVAMQMIKKKGILHDYYHRLKNEKGPKSGKVALTAVMRKALYLIQAIVKSGVPFDRQKYMNAA